MCAAKRVLTSMCGQIWKVISDDPFLFWSSMDTMSLNTSNTSNTRWITKRLLKDKVVFWWWWEILHGHMLWHGSLLGDAWSQQLAESVENIECYRLDVCDMSPTRGWAVLCRIKYSGLNNPITHSFSFILWCNSLLIVLHAF